MEGRCHVSAGLPSSEGEELHALYAQQLAVQRQGGEGGGGGGGGAAAAANALQAVPRVRELVGQLLRLLRYESSLQAADPAIWARELRLRMFRNDFGWRSEAGALGVVQGAPVEPAAVALEHGSAAIVDLEGDTARSSYYRTGDGLNRGYQGAMHLGAMLRDLATQPRGDAWHEALQRKRREGAALSRAVEQNSLEAAVREVLLMSGNSLEDRIQIA